MSDQIITHTNANGIHYYSKKNNRGMTIYSFSIDFEDIWGQADQDTYGS